MPDSSQAHRERFKAPSPQHHQSFQIRPCQDGYEFAHVFTSRFGAAGSVVGSVED
jgi:hypothetical protein